ncbi:MAG: FtsX-like permease family protein [Austwickia sp.]|jgi:putative ABC transport system permease protein|nr:FtsX-like permease family protein [Austwickia sp.]MBK8436264.1 FtsX-like permease family protein [Austwickia sp.]MBK9101941.1 FtsX-like permease family protein [Austwickia sp.]
MLSLIWSRLRSQARPFLAPGLAVLLGVAFVTVAAVLAGSLAASLTTAIAGQYERSAAVVRPGAAVSGPAAAEPDRGAHGPVLLAPNSPERIAALPGVGVVHAVREEAAMLARLGGEAGPGGPDQAWESVDPVLARLATAPAPASPARLSQGRWPVGTREVALSEGAATRLRIAVGDRVALAPLDLTGPGGPNPVPGGIRVVGVLDTAGDPRLTGGMPVVIATPAALASWTGRAGWTEIDVEAATGTDAQDLRDRVRATGVTVLSGAEAAAEAMTSFTSGIDVLGGILIGFAGLATFVSALVIANTYGILMSRRRHETGLIRAIGAARGQVIRATLMEAALLGIIASILGVLTGLAAAAVLIRLGRTSLGPDRPVLTMTLGWLDVVGPWVVGVAVVLCAAVAPVVRAAGVAPVQALAPATEPSASGRAGRARIAGGLTLIVFGAALLVQGASAASVAIGMVGAAVSFLGVMAAGRLLIPGLARLVGALTGGLFGVPGRLAVLNAVRSPARAASTATALLIGVTLITTVAVGHASLKATALSSIDSRYAVDLAVTSPRVLPPGLGTRIGGVAGVGAAVELPGTSARTDDGVQHAVIGLPAQAAPAVHGDRLLAAAVPGTLLVSPDQVLRSAGRGQPGELRDGGRIRLTGPTGSVSLTVRVSPALGLDWVISPDDLRRLDAAAAPRAVLVALTPDADPQQVLQAVTTATQPLGSGVQVTGHAAERAEFGRALDVVLAVVITLLAVSVLVALVGIANTLSLSVLERTGELAVLRALGLTRGQLRRMLAGEAVVLALVAVLLGTGLGLAYGLAGARALYGGRDVLAVVPWSLLALAAAVSVAAAMAASVLPGRRAANVPPSAALAAP